MKKLLVGLLAIGSLSASANLPIKGVVELSNFTTIADTTFMTISGEAALKIWNDMISVPALPASQFQPYEMKSGHGINCEMLNSESVRCHISINSPDGRINLN